MTAQAPVRTEQRPAPAQVAEHTAWSTPGIKVLVAGIVGAVAAIALLLDARGQARSTAVALDWAGAILLLAAVLLLVGLTPIVPGQARVIQLFGKYRGTARDTGLQWVNPFTRRIKISTRIRNHETAQAKVNDADGNPIEIAAVVVWRVQDTLKRLGEEGVVELDEERKAAMVSNLLVVLCSEQATQQVVNTGSLYQ
jgi:SPFH domain / Band 7 family